MVEILTSYPSVSPLLRMYLTENTQTNQWFEKWHNPLCHFVQTATKFVKKKLNSKYLNRIKFNWLNSKKSHSTGEGNFTGSCLQCQTRTLTWLITWYSTHIVTSYKYLFARRWILDLNIYLSILLQEYLNDKITASTYSPHEKTRW